MRGDGLDATEPSLWAARVMVAALSDGDVNLLAAFAATSTPDNPWRVLAQEKCCCWHGNAKAAVRLYEDSNMEGATWANGRPARRDRIPLVARPASSIWPAPIG